MPVIGRRDQSSLKQSVLFVIERLEYAFREHRSLDDDHGR